MTSSRADKYEIVKKQYYDFALKHIRPLGLSSWEEFPLELWKKMTDEGLTGLCLQDSCDNLSIISASHGLVSGSANLGFALSWLINEIVTKYFNGNLCCHA